MSNFNPFKLNRFTVNNNKSKGENWIREAIIKEKSFLENTNEVDKTSHQLRLTSLQKALSELQQEKELAAFDKKS